MNHKSAMKIHANTRAAQRLGIELDSSMRRRIAKEIKRRRGHRDRSTNREQHRVTMDGITMIVVWDVARKEIVTVFDK